MTTLLVCGGDDIAWPASFTVVACESIDAVVERAASAAFDAVLADADATLAQTLLAPPWQTLLREHPMLLRARGELDEALALRLVAAGVQDLLGDAADLERRVRFAIERKRRERDARKSWSTDLDTGLPNRDQLFEHLSQLLALRKRQPALMALLALRIDGLDAIAAQHGAESARIVRRKIAVRLRGLLRASDVVASLGEGDGFAVLLAKIEAATDAQRVVLKVARALREPFSVLGQAAAVTAHIGVALHPGHATDGQALLRDAASAAIAAQRRGGAAAND